MQPTATIWNAQRQRDTTEHDGRKTQRKPHDQAEGCWTTRGKSTPETKTCQQHVESTGATETNATAAADGLKHDASAYDATENDAATNDANAATASDGHEHDADASDEIWSTSAATIVEDDVPVRGE